MQIQPLGNRVLVEPAPKESTTEGGLIIPDTAKEKPRHGKVIAIGAEVAGNREVSVGQQVLYGKYSGNELSFEGTNYLIIEASDLIAKLND